VLKRSTKALARRLGLRKPAAEQPVKMGRFTHDIEKLRRDVVALRDGKVGVKRFAREIERLARELQEAEARIEVLEYLAGHPDALASSDSINPFSSPAVSVVMPTWNRAALVGAAIRSVQAQTFADWELLVVDDGSTDGTRQLVESFGSDSRIRYIAQEHRGEAPARNTALRLAKGELIAYLDSDNIWFPEFLSAAVAVFAARPDVDCAYGANVRDHPPQILHRPFDRARLLEGNYIDMSAFVHRRVLVDRHGDFDERLDRLSDWDIVLRYTVHAPAFRLPMRAVRYRHMDGIRVSDTRPVEQAIEIIRGKWRDA
jgi:hypothetical protein